MIHLSLYMLSALFVLAVCWVVMAVGYTLLIALIRVLSSWINRVIGFMAALVFWLVIVPPLWAWLKWRRWVETSR